MINSRFIKILFCSLVVGSFVGCKKDLYLPQEIKEQVILEQNNENIIKNETVIVKILNIRELPNVNSKIIGKLKKDTKIQYIEVIQNKKNTWLKLKDGGYVSADATTFQKVDFKNEELDNIFKDISNTNESIKIINEQNSIEKNKVDMLQNSALYSKDNIKDSLKTNLRSPDAPPLYLNPTFAKITIFPYVSNAGHYHSYEEVWVKIKDGKFILNQRDVKKNKVKE